MCRDGPRAERARRVRGSPRTASPRSRRARVAPRPKGRRSPPPRPRRGARSPQHPRLPGDPELADRRERDAPVEHAEIVAADLLEERAVDGGHDEAGALARAILAREAAPREVVVAERAIGLERHQRAKALVLAPREDVLRLEAEERELVGRKVHAVAPRV